MNNTPCRFQRGALVCIVLLCLSVLTPSTVLSSEAVRPTAPVSLFNGRDHTGWLAVAREGDAKETWSVRDGVLAATGSPYGYLRTDRAYRDYKLLVEWRWTVSELPTDAQGKPRGRNSGVLLHMQGEDKVWPVCLEAQLQQDNAGDFITMAPSVLFEELRAKREKAVASAGADEAARARAQSDRRLARQHPSSEKPVGEWNVYEIVCRGTSVTLTVNGVLQNTATGLTLGDGWIGVQSEGAPIEFRRLDLLPLPQE